MRILVITESLEHGGGARSVRFLANALSRENIDIHVYGVGVFLCYEKRIRLIESPGDKSMSFKFLMGFIRAAKITQPDIVHTNGMYTAMVALFVRKVFKFKYKTIMTLHHTSETFRANWIAKRLIPFLNNVDMVHYLTPYQKSIYEKRNCGIFVSLPGYRTLLSIDFFKETFLKICYNIQKVAKVIESQFGEMEGKVCLIPNGVTVNLLQKDQFMQQREKVGTLIGVGRLTQQKDNPNLLQAFRLLEKN